jgi:hypothetical protein
VTAVRNLSDFRRWAESSPRLASGLIFAGPDPDYGLGLEGLLPDYRVASGAESPSAALLRLRGRDVIALAGGSGSSLSLLEHPDFEGWLHSRQRSATAAGPPLLVFKSSFALQGRASALGLQLLAADAGLARRWENKVAFREIASRLALPQPEGMVFDPAELDFAAVQRKLGSPFVLQAPHGYGGAKTWSIADAADYASATEDLRARELKATALIDGLPLTLTACVTAQGVAVSRPFYQLTGEASLTCHRLGSCGNDWQALEHRSIDLATAMALADRVGRALAVEGYRGIFGLDLVSEFETGRIYVIEVNPRLVASIALHSQLELLAGRLPLLARHILAHLQPELDAADLEMHREPLQGGQAILHNLDDAPRRVGASLETGVYALGAEGALEFLRPALGVKAIQNQAEFLILAPEEGREIASGQTWTRIQRRDGVCDPDGQISSAVAAAIQALDREARWEDV